METIDVLGRVDSHQHARLVNLRRERKLNQNPVDGRIRIELLHEHQQLGLRSISRKGDLAGVETEITGIPILHAYVDLARGILAHQHGC
tara:strand:- start:4952 stop:5218 length:267 start_codon:yes stop_codon:yes gene_type:complete